MLPGRAVTVENFRLNITNLQEKHFDGKAHRFAKRLGLAGSSPKGWLKRGSSPTWASLVDLGFRLDIPPIRLGHPELELTDPSFWHHRPVATLDRPHVRPSQSKLIDIGATLLGRLRASDPEVSLEGLPKLAKTLEISLGVLKRHFPTECQALIEKRKAIVKAKGDVRRVAQGRRIAAATAAVLSKELPVTTRNLRLTGLMTVADLTKSTKR